MPAVPPAQHDVHKRWLACTGTSCRALAFPPTNLSAVSQPASWTPQAQSLVHVVALPLSSPELRHQAQVSRLCIRPAVVAHLLAMSAMSHASSSKHHERRNLKRTCWPWELLTACTRARASSQDSRRVSSSAGKLFRSALSCSRPHFLRNWRRQTSPALASGLAPAGT